MRGYVRARMTTIGTTAATLPAGQARTLPLKLTAAGRRMLARHGRLAATVRVAVTGATLASQVFQQRMTLTTGR